MNVFAILAVVALAVGGLMPSTESLEPGRVFMLPCANEDPFVVWVQGFDTEASKDQEVYGVFAARLQVVNKPLQDKPFLVLETDGVDKFVKEYLDSNQDGKVDYEGELGLGFGDDDGDGEQDITQHVCELARKVKQ